MVAISDWCMSWITTSCDEPAILLTSSIVSLHVEQPALKTSIFFFVVMVFPPYDSWNRLWHRSRYPGEAAYSRAKHLPEVRSRRIPWAGNPTRTCQAERRRPRVLPAGKGRTRGDLLP